ncbi:MAG: SMI1/KNR4 family protein [Lachnospiraceae bacterium]|nr:SMI1/KNR4 family protein [Lachnospiraceae bacterium]
MTIAEEYLKKLQEREPQLFPEPLKKSTLADKDLLEIEKSLGHKLPEQYKEFLQSYQLPDTTVYLSFLGDVFGDWDRTFSREKNDYVPVDLDNDVSTLMDMEWHNISAANATEWLKQFHENEFINGYDAALHEAGYIYLGAIDEGYYILYDLVQGDIFYLHHESVYDIGYEYGEGIMDGGMPEKLREGVCQYGGCQIYKDFNDFLRHICLGEHYDESDKVFVDEEDLENYQ